MRMAQGIQHIEVGTRDEPRRREAAINASDDGGVERELALGPTLFLL